MSDLLFSELKLKNVKRSEESFFQLVMWTPMEWACAMAGEAGEACNKIKHFQLEYGGRPLDYISEHEPEVIREIANELGDVVTYCDLLATRLNIDLGEAVRDKFNIVSEKVCSQYRL